MNTRTRFSTTIRALTTCVAIFLGASRGAADESNGLPAAGTNIPPTVRITCPTPTPLFVFYTNPRLRVHWEGHDPDGPGGQPVEYKFILLGPGSEFPVSLAVADPDSLRRYYAGHPQGPWTGWDSTGTDEPSALLENLILNEQFVFVVIAFDASGDYSRIFSLSSNMLRFVTTYAGYQGPVITLTGPGLDYTYPSGGYCPCTSAEVPVEVPAHPSATFGWSAEATIACDHEGVRSYRWALDMDDVGDETPRTDEETDLKHWSAPSLATISATLTPSMLASPPAPHRLYVEAADNLGFKSLGIVRITVVPAVNGSPDCVAAAADPSGLWPPNHRLVRVHIGGVTDPDGDPVTIRVTRVTQDEPTSQHGSEESLAASDASDDAAAVEGSAGAGVEDLGHIGVDPPGVVSEDPRGECVDAILDPDGGVRLRAERDGHGNGRVYTVWFTASDDQGGSCDGSVKVCVPRDRRHPACVDDGRTFDSLGPCKGSRHGDRAAMLEVATPSAASGVATIEYALPSAGRVLVAVYDVTGRRFGTLVNEFQSAGAHRATWNHAGIAQGMYFVRLWSPAASLTRSLLILR